MMAEPEPAARQAYAEMIVVDGRVVRATQQNSRNRRCRECGCICWQCSPEHTCCSATVCCTDRSLARPLYWSLGPGKFEGQ